jgi:hypothetical protein
MKRLRLLVLLVAVSAILTTLAAADTVSFGPCITNNNVVDCNTNAQYTVIVTAVGSAQVSFQFLNSGPAPSSITDIYFDDGSLLGIATITNGTGTSFSQGASPGDLPGGNSISPAFVTTAGFLADSDPPAQPNGVNPGESVTIIFDLQSGQTFSDVQSELSSGALRIGIHVQGFTGGGSESFVNGPPVTPQPIPEPATVLLLGTGLAGAATRLVRRRR